MGISAIMKHCEKLNLACYYNSAHAVAQEAQYTSIQCNF